MQYLLIIHVEESKLTTMSADERIGVLAEYRDLIGELKGKGMLVGAQRLAPAATTARIINGEPQVYDGPFAETREQIGGYFLVDVPDRDAATKIALRLPGARLGAIEVREVAMTS